MCISYYRLDLHIFIDPKLSEDDNYFPPLPVQMSNRYLNVYMYVTNCIVSYNPIIKQRYVLFKTKHDKKISDLET